MAHAHALIRDYSASVARSRDIYRTENHCACGEFHTFVPNHREARTCDRCKLRDAITKEIH